MDISLITPTGLRPEAFSLCEKWIKNQKDVHPHKIKEWIVVDDYPLKPTKCTMGQFYIRGPKAWTPQINTQRYNMDAALEKVRGDIIFIIEDDEYYSPYYLKEMIALLQNSSIAGISNSRYYHLKVPGYRTMDNFRHASLCQTALRRESLDLLFEAVHSGQYYFDIEFWKRAQDKEIPFALISNSNLSIGIKGMPGRAGLGVGHEVIGYRRDPSLSVFKEWVGHDFENYLPFLKKSN